MINSVNKAEIESSDLVINNPDQENNFANFEYGILLFNTINPKTQDWNKTLGVAQGDIKDTYATSSSYYVIPNINLKVHQNGTKAIYLYSYKARRVTNKPMNCTLRVKLEINCCQGYQPMALSRSSIRSSTSSIPTLRRISPSDNPFLMRSSRGMDACVMVAG